MSSKLFNIFYDSLLNRLEKLEVFIVAYADDIVIGTTSKPMISKVIKETELWAKKYEMRFN